MTTGARLYPAAVSAFSGSKKINSRHFYSHVEYSSEGIELVPTSFILNTRFRDWRDAEFSCSQRRALNINGQRVLRDEAVVYEFKVGRMNVLTIRQHNNMEQAMTGLL